MERIAINIRSDVLGIDEFEREFDDIWAALVNDKPALAELATQAVPIDEIRNKTRTEVIRFEQSPSAGLATHVAQIILESAIRGLIPAVLNWVLQRMMVGRPQNAIVTAEAPVQASAATTRNQ